MSLNTARIDRHLLRKMDDDKNGVDEHFGFSSYVCEYELNDSLSGRK
jgi:hypothetical protein